jgi:hypothetical protein
MNSASPTALIANTITLRCGLHRIRMRTTAERAIGNGGLLPRRLAVVEALTARVLETVPVDGFTLAGEKLYVTPAGRPEQLSETGASNPFDGVTVTVVVPLCRRES